MTALDQAFIKAYMHQGGGGQAAASFSSARPTLLAESLADPPKQESSQPPMDSLAEAVARAFEKPPARQRNHTSACPIPPEEPGPAVPSDSPAEPDTLKIRDFPEFRPALQVDRYLWSNVCSRLGAAASDQLDCLAESIARCAISGQRAVGICGCRRGDGCTTLLLCAAHRLAAQAARVVLIDADFDQPVLASRLGLLPEVGWEDVLWQGLPLSEAVIESVEDRLAVLPLRGASQSDANKAAGQVDPTSDIDLLRRRYDMVLIDLGRFDCSTAKAAAVLQTAHNWIGSVVVVHNVCAEQPAEVDQLRRRLRQVGLAEAGVAENFV